MESKEIVPATSQDPLNAVSIGVKNYKCFGETPQGFDVIKPINVLIGRNNSGKSSLLDLIDYATSPKKGYLNISGYRGKEPEVIIIKPLTEPEIKMVFKENASNHLIGNFWNFGKRFVGKRITIGISDDYRKKQFINIESDVDVKDADKYLNELASRIDNPFATFIFKKIQAERDVRPEIGSNELKIQENGNGATSILERFINKSSLPSELVEETLLNELNKIIEPDSSFKRIIIQQLDSSDWEIFLEEEHKGRIALSKSGSGLKTILIVLIYILLVPYIDKKPLSNYIFSFEELENNLHPALQRRLFLYLREKALTEKTHFFLTTHSNVVIDLFSSDNLAQIYHIIHNGIEATSNPVKTYMQKTGILDDLEIRASDLLQSNGVIWVEGPSDRLYVNRWIELWSDGKLREGAHYQCIFYGGRLLAHLSGEVPGDEESKLIKILSTNRNAIVLIDSDKRIESDEINDTKKRICKEIEEINGFCWVTAGKEVENYISKSIISKLYEIKVESDLKLYDIFWDYLEKIKPGEGKLYSDKKVVFAERIRPYLDKKSLSTTFDMENRMDEIISRIKKWNNIR
jgi:putative ATP-dependent endonuclease of the OLD family